MADRGYVLSHGELAASGPAGQLGRDRALLAASYLGSAAGRAPDDGTPDGATPDGATG